MPILPAEPDLYPADFWEGDAPPAASGRLWWCLHTKPRQEKATARHLRHRELAFYLPLVARESRTPGGRKIRSIIPLFPGYVFLLADEVERVEALRGDTVVQALPVGDPSALQRDLRQIHRMLASGLPVVPEATFPVGARVRILNGPLTGLVGVVVRRDKQARFSAIVTFLGQAAAVDLRDWQVEPAAD